MFLPVARSADGGQVRVITFGGIPAVPQQINVHHAFSAIANRKVFLIVDIVGTEARRLRLGDGNPLFRKFEEGLLAMLADVVRFVAGAHFGTFQAATAVWFVSTCAGAFCAWEQMRSRLL